VFEYFGCKQRDVAKYPRPQYGLVIEPFCGSARYACRYGISRDCWINDADPRIWNVWRWTQNATLKDIESLPSLTRHGETLADHKYLSNVERDLLGFSTGSCRTEPSDRVSPWGEKKYGTAKLKYHLRYLCGRIVHWKITCMDYRELPNLEATYFIDPPYQYMGGPYKHNQNGIDYDCLGNWCRERKGQVVACEGVPSNWDPPDYLPFGPLKQERRRTQRNDKYIEFVFCQKS
jgi:site-specific DNA-adenine methylase